jgi:3-methyladenine DNA glycosylase/8-oxoguanine DNA glycosylase
MPAVARVSGAGGQGRVVLEIDARPRGPFRLPPAGRDGVVRRRGRALARLVHCDEDAAVVWAWPVAGAVRLRAEAAGRACALHGLERMRFALGLDHDLAPFHAHVRRDPLLGPVARRRPWLRPRRHADPFQALAWAVSEQLIEAERAFGIQRRLVWRYGRESACGLRDAPSARALADRAPAELQACDLSGGRARTLVRAAREVALGRVDLGRHEEAWRRLRVIPGIGSWTVEKLALEGQGRDDQLPAGDLAYVKLVGRLARLGRRASEDEVRRFFAPYAPFSALAGLYALAAAAARPEVVAPRRPGLAPTDRSRAGGRW